MQMCSNLCQWFLVVLSCTMKKSLKYLLQWLPCRYQVSAFTGCIAARRTNGALFSPGQTSRILSVHPPHRARALGPNNFHALFWTLVYLCLFCIRSSKTRSDNCWVEEDYDFPQAAVLDVVGLFCWQSTLLAYVHQSSQVLFHKPTASSLCLYCCTGFFLPKCISPRAPVDLIPHSVQAQLKSVD